MRRTLIAILAVVASVCVVPVPSAQAARPDVIHGGCFLETVADPSADGTQVGVIGDLSVTRTGAIPTMPIGATVSCWIEVDGVEAPGTRFSYSGLGAQAGADRISYTAADSEIVAECQSVTFADGTTQALPCPAPLGPFYLPPRSVTELLVELFDFADALVCPALAAGVGTYGPVTIAPDGDVYLPDPFALGINPFWDCPPYITP